MLAEPACSVAGALARLYAVGQRFREVYEAMLGVVCARGPAVADPSLICSEAADLANPMEPSALGGDRGAGHRRAAGPAGGGHEPPGRCVLMAAFLRTAGGPLPGLALCAAIAAAARALQALERSLFGHAWLDSLVLAILIGAAIRTGWEPAPAFRPGIRRASGTLLEVAVVLLGASLDPRAVAAGGLQLPLFIAAVVVLCLAAGYGTGRLLGLPHRTAMLIACGNAICGNSGDRRRGAGAGRRREGGGWSRPWPSRPRFGVLAGAGAAARSAPRLALLRFAIRHSSRG